MANAYESGRLNLPFVGISTFGKRPYVDDWSKIQALTDNEVFLNIIEVRKAETNGGASMPACGKTSWARRRREAHMWGSTAIRAGLPDGPFNYKTGETQDIRVSVYARGLEYPYSMAFLPTGELLVTERAGPRRRAACATP